MLFKPSSGLRRWVVYQAIRFFRIRDSREKGARGFAIGIACNFFPTFGLGGFLSGFLAHLFGGSMVAGFIGGSMLAFFWPVLFYLNIRTGTHFIPPPVPVDDLDDVTPRVINALVWGKTFALGCVINSLLAGVAAYLLFLFLFEHWRPHALNWLRGRARVLLQTEMEKRLR